MLNRIGLVVFVLLFVVSHGNNYELKVTVDSILGGESNHHEATNLVGTGYISKCDIKYSSWTDQFWADLNIGRDAIVYSLHFNRNGTNVPNGASNVDTEWFTQVDTIYEGAGNSKNPKIGLIGTDDEETVISVWNKYFFASSEELEQFGSTADRWQSLFQLQDSTNANLLGNNSHVCSKKLIAYIGVTL